jgi:hypothetical protein
VASTINDFAIKVLCEDPNYDIRPDGKIYTLIERTGKRSSKNNWRLKPETLNLYGYVRVKYDYRDLFLHRIVAQKFIGNIDGLQVNHLDGNRANNHKDNLELCTQSENILHSYRVLKRKPNFNNCKIDFQTAEFIRELFSKGINQKELAEQFKLSKGTISEIITGKIWKAAANG